MKLLNYLLLLCGFLFGGGMLCSGQIDSGGGEKLPLQLDIGIMNEELEPIDSALIRIYNEEHKFLGEYYSSTELGFANTIVDTAVINYYGCYYIEVSKTGYKTEEIKYELKNEGITTSAGITLRRENESGTGVIWGIVAVVVVGGGGVLYWRRKRSS